MNIFKLLDIGSPRFYAVLLLILSSGAVSNFCVILIINNIINQTPYPPFRGFEVILFLVFLAVLMLSQRYFQMLLIRKMNDFTTKLELTVIEKLRACSYEAFEKLGIERVHSAIEDVYGTSRIPTMIATFLNSSLIVLCGIVYLFFIAPLGAAVLIFTMASVSIFYSWNEKRLTRHYNHIRDLQNVFYKLLNDLTRGMKEIKLNSVLNNVIFSEHINRNRDAMRGAKVGIQVKILNQEMIGNFAPYLLLFVILFVLKPLFNTPSTEIASFTIILLYILGPLNEMIRIFSQYPQVKVAMIRINSFSEALSEDPSFQSSINQSSEIEHFKSLRFEEVGYQYYDKEKERVFNFGPLNLEIKSGETVFVTGGNGSGKSTFIKLLTGIYRPISGSIFMNDRLIRHEEYETVKSKISAIFTDNHMFCENYLKHDLVTQDGAINTYIDIMKLREILFIDRTNNSIDIKLSKGQQKRVALIYALLENNPIIVLDEWAAEQDPEFRSYFYQTILPELRNRGKTVIAVTHDELYFKYANNLIRFDYGKAVSISQN